jgi:hypothetical protein
MLEIAALLIRLGSAHVTDWSREGEFLMDTNIVYVEAPGVNFFPAASFDGTNYFIVWEDTRSDESYDIYGARVTQSGTILDQGGIPICATFGDQEDPAVAFNGTNYLVVWLDRSSGSFDVWGARVTPSGEVLDSTGIPISVGSHEHWSPDVGSDGTNNLVVWEDNRGAYADIYGARVTPSGVVIDTNGFIISDATYGQGQPSLAFDGSNFLVVWLDGRIWGNQNIYCGRVTPSGIVLDTNGIPISTPPYDLYNPCVAFDGTNYLTVWHDGSDIYGTRVSTAGAVLDPQGIAISTAVNDQHYASIAFDGTNYLVVWQDHSYGAGNPEIVGARIDPQGSVLDPNGIQITLPYPYTDNCRPTIAFGGANYLVAWYHYQASGSMYGIYGTRVSPSATVLDSSGLLIATAANAQYNPGIAFDGTNYLAIWEDTRIDTCFDIYGIRISPTGTILDQTSIPVCTTEKKQGEPRVIFGGGNYFVVWEDKRNGNADIYGARISPSGVVLEPNGIPISMTSPAERYPSVTFDGTNYFVVWLDYRYNCDIFGARVSSSGLVLDTVAIMIDTVALGPGPPAVAFDGQNYLVVWSAYPGVGPPTDLYGIRVSHEGAVLDPAAFVVTNAPGHQRRPVIDFDGADYLVVWEDWRYYQDSANIYGARVDTSGAVLDSNGIIITSAQRHQGYPALVFDGVNHVVVWEDKRNGAYYDIYGAKLDTSGSVIDTFVLSTQTAHQRMPAVACGITDQILVAYSSWTFHINNCPANTFRVWGKFHPLIGMEEAEPSTIRKHTLAATVFRGPLQLPEDKKCKVFDITGRVVEPSKIRPGIYFIEVDGIVTLKVVKVR